MTSIEKVYQLVIFCSNRGYFSRHYTIQRTRTRWINQTKPRRKSQILYSSKDGSNDNDRPCG